MSSNDREIAIDTITTFITTEECYEKAVLAHGAVMASFADRMIRDLFNPEPDEDVKNVLVGLGSSISALHNVEGLVDWVLESSNATVLADAIVQSYEKKRTRADKSQNQMVKDREKVKASQKEQRQAEVARVAEQRASTKEVETKYAAEVLARLNSEQSEEQPSKLDSSSSMDSNVPPVSESQNVRPSPPPHRPFVKTESQMERVQREGREWNEIERKICGIIMPQISDDSTDKELMENCIIQTINDYCQDAEVETLTQWMQHSKLTFELTGKIGRLKCLQELVQRDPVFAKAFTDSVVSVYAGIQEAAELEREEKQLREQAAARASQEEEQRLQEQEAMVFPGNIAALGSILDILDPQIRSALEKRGYEDAQIKKLLGDDDDDDDVLTSLLGSFEIITKEQTSQFADRLASKTQLVWEEKRSLSSLLKALGQQEQEERYGELLHQLQGNDELVSLLVKVVTQLCEIQMPRKIQGQPSATVAGIAREDDAESILSDSSVEEQEKQEKIEREEREALETQMRSSVEMELSKTKDFDKLSKTQKTMFIQEELKRKTAMQLTAKGQAQLQGKEAPVNLYSVGKPRVQATEAEKADALSDLQNEVNRLQSEAARVREADLKKDEELAELRRQLQVSQSQTPPQEQRKAPPPPPQALEKQAALLELEQMRLQIRQMQEEADKDRQALANQEKALAQQETALAQAVSEKQAAERAAEADRAKAEKAEKQAAEMQVAKQRAAQEASIAAEIAAQRDTEAKVAAERVARERTEQERVERERAEKERQEREQAVRAEAAERIKAAEDARAKAEADRVTAERARVVAEQQVALDQAALVKAEGERLAALEAARAAGVKAAADAKTAADAKAAADKRAKQALAGIRAAGAANPKKK